MQEAATGALSQAERSYPTSKARGGSWEEPPHVQGQCHPMLKRRNHPLLKIRKGSSEWIPLTQGKEQQLRFAGAAMERYPTPKVRVTKVRR